MATSKDFITSIEKELSHIPEIRTRAMFGEYALYCRDVVVSLICDETIYLKITPQTEELMPTDTEKGPPYPGAKEHYIIPERMLEEKAFMKKVLEACSKDVAASKKPKKKR